MTKQRNGEVCVENATPGSNGKGIVIGVDGGTTSTVCVCLRLPDDNSELSACDPLVIGRAVAGCSNYNSVGEAMARETIEEVIKEALKQSGCDQSDVQSVCLAMSGVNSQSDQQLVLQWLRKLFPSNAKLFVRNDAVAALASGTAGKLNGCVLIAGTGTIAYGFTEDGGEARAAGAGPILGDWGSGYGIAAQALTAIVKAHDGRGPSTILTSAILSKLHLSCPDEVIGWTYSDPSWARIAALVPVVKSCAKEGDPVAQDIMLKAVEELTDSVKAVVQRLGLSGYDGRKSFPLVMVGGVIQNEEGWNIGREVVRCISKEYPNVIAIRPKVEPAVGAAFLAWNFYLDFLSKGSTKD
eukprot:TRINITY_DN6219_c0_g1_i1.p1 TRINITY_DN6219_c0_g1~~TRINITY_DN6219_c0_g1_i1.p1  ORF type:complete len:354 (+),score=84.01 TRINITY_DN6219_c0_g1_i1:342-1403(+)